MMQPIELVQRESTSQRWACIKAHGLFTASLATEICLGAKMHWDLGSKSLQVNEGDKERWKPAGPGVQLHRSSAVPDTTPLTTESDAAVTPWEKQHVLQLLAARKAGRAACLVQPLKGHVWAIQFFKQKTPTDRYPGYKKEKSLNALIAKVTKNTYKLSLKVDVKYVQQQCE